jgi:hypothetical protein
MKLNIVILLFITFIILSQDTKEKSTGLQEIRDWKNTSSLDSTNSVINAQQGRVSSYFKHNSPESWNQLLPASGRQDASMMNINTVAQSSGVQYDTTQQFEPVPYAFK